MREINDGRNLKKGQRRGRTLSRTGMALLLFMTAAAVSGCSGRTAGTIYLSGKSMIKMEVNQDHEVKTLSALNNPGKELLEGQNLSKKDLDGLGDQAVLDTLIQQMQDEDTDLITVQVLSNEDGWVLSTVDRLAEYFESPDYESRIPVTVEDANGQSSIPAGKTEGALSSAEVPETLETDDGAETEETLEMAETSETEETDETSGSGETSEAEETSPAEEAEESVEPAAGTTGGAAAEASTETPASRARMAETTAAETTAPETAAPETIAAETTMAETAVPSEEATETAVNTEAADAVSPESERQAVEAGGDESSGGPAAAAAGTGTSETGTAETTAETQAPADTAAEIQTPAAETGSSVVTAGE